MRLRGLRDIKTHGSLAREGRLVSVARDWHKLNNRGGDKTESGGFADGWDAKQHLVKNKPVHSVTASSLCRDRDFEKKSKSQQIERIIYLLTEFQRAIQEGLPVSLSAFESLKARLTELKG